jgi:uncharacterized protein (DUF2141 family)
MLNGDQSLSNGNSLGHGNSFVSDDARPLGGPPAFEQSAFFVQNNFPRDTTPRGKLQIPLRRARRNP